LHGQLRIRRGLHDHFVAAAPDDQAFDFDRFGR
jgi:hypothetical protein